MRRGLDQPGCALLVSARDQYQSTPVFAAVALRFWPPAMAPISEERSGSVWVDGTTKDGNGSALSILKNPKSPSRFRPAWFIGRSPHLPLETSSPTASGSTSDFRYDTCRGSKFGYGVPFCRLDFYPACDFFGSIASSATGKGPISRS
jgi:hypothetical protein